MASPHVASRLPVPVDLVAGEATWWCACGLSQNQPFCDGSHAGTEFEPLEHIAEEDGRAFFCGCKHTSNPPFCDGTHGVL